MSATRLTDLVFTAGLTLILAALGAYSLAAAAGVLGLVLCAAATVRMIAMARRKRGR